MKKIFLSIAATDSIGGAGIQADNRTALNFGLYPVNVVTAVTAQNSSGFEAIEPVSTDIIERQFRAVCDDLRPDCVKIGMLPDKESIEVVARLLGEYGLKNIVLDPVLAPTKGNISDREDLALDILEHFKTIVTLVTPNVSENFSFKLKTPHPEEIFDAYLLKGGDSFGSECHDVLFYKNSKREIKKAYFSSLRVRTSNLHGTGCVLSSAIACCLALGMDLIKAVQAAKLYVTENLIKNSDVSFGKGLYGPVLF